MDLDSTPSAQNLSRGVPSRLSILFLLAVVGQAKAAEGETGSQSADAVARELANPNSSLATLTLKNQYRLYTGDLPRADDQRSYTALFQPVFPLSLPIPEHGGKATLFIRPAFPECDLQGPVPASKRH